MSIESNLIKLLKENDCQYEENWQSYIFTCPKCNKIEKLYLRKRDARFICWYCAGRIGYSGKGEYFLSDLLGQNVTDLKDAIYGPQELTLDIDWTVEWEKPPEDVEFVVYKYPYDFYTLDEKISAKGVAYLESRGISLEVGLKYDVRYCPTSRSVVFPIKKDGYLLGWQERLTVPHEVVVDGILYKTNKTKTARGVDRENLVMWANTITGPTVVLCEGPITALKAYKCGGFAATMGKVVTKHQMFLLKRMGVKTIYMALDVDARIESDRLVREWCLDFDFMDMYPRPWEVLKKGQDQGDLDPDLVLRQFKAARPYELNALCL